MQNMILCSTGLIVNMSNDQNHALIAEYLPALKYDGFELEAKPSHIDNPGRFAAADAAILAAIDKGAKFYTMHTYKEIGSLISRNGDGDAEKALRLFEDNCHNAVRYGIKLLVLHLWGGRDSDKNIGFNLAFYPKLKAIADRRGLILTVENIVCNTHRPLQHMRRLWEMYGGEVRFTIDTRQAEFHKSLRQTCESDFLWDNNLVEHLHISDYSGAEYDWEKFLPNDTYLGRGDVDFDYFWGFLRSAGFVGLVTAEKRKIDPGNDDYLHNLNMVYDFIRAGLSN